MYSWNYIPCSFRAFRGIRTRLSTPALVLRLAWLVLIVYGEYWTFKKSVSEERCHWPQSNAADWDDQASSPFHLLLLADPQILDHHSYPGRPAILKWLGEKITDNFARKSWSLTLRNTKPDAVIFLGDLLDAGVETRVDPIEHALYVQRFYRLFAPPAGDLPIYYVPGNHDLGLHSYPNMFSSAPSMESSSFNPSPPTTRDNFREYFGPPNWASEIGNHTVVTIDSMGLLEERREIGDRWFEQGGWELKQGGVFEFVERFARNRPSASPLILLSHIPLSRPEGTYCGRWRESSRPIRQGHGLNYQNEMDPETTDWLLERLKPDVVFSGDDHDQCEIIHSLKSDGSKIPEFSVKSFSMAMGVKNPGFMLVSLSSHPSTPHSIPSLTSNNQEQSPPGFSGAAALSSSTTQKITHLQNLCLLPDQIQIYTNLYLPFFVFTLFVLVFNRFKSRPGASSSSATHGVNDSSSLSLSPMDGSLPMYNNPSDQGRKAKLSYDGGVNDKLDPVEIDRPNITPSTTNYAYDDNDSGVTFAPSSTVNTTAARQRSSSIPPPLLSSAPSTTRSGPNPRNDQLATLKEREDEHAFVTSPWPVKGCSGHNPLRWFISNRIVTFVVSSQLWLIAWPAVFLYSGFWIYYATF